MRTQRKKITLETELSENMRTLGESLVISKDGDFLPSPHRMGIANYLYLSYIYIPKQQRNKGIASNLIKNLLAECNRSIYTELVDSDITWGNVLVLFCKDLGLLKCFQPMI